jgi:hypothetical protein
MAAAIVNLRQARKRKLRAEKEAIAAENRARFGRPKSERRHEAATKDLETRQLDGLKRMRSKATDPD